MSETDAAIDVGYRNLAFAIVLQAVRDTNKAATTMDATDFLTSPECKTLLRLAGIRWTATVADIRQAATEITSRRLRRKPRQFHDHVAFISWQAEKRLASSLRAYSNGSDNQG